LFEAEILQKSVRLHNSNSKVQGSPPFQRLQRLLRTSESVSRRLCHSSIRPSRNKQHGVIGQTWPVK
jgi:hypothetical protein